MCLLLQLGEVPAAIDYVQAQQLRRQLSHDFAKAFNKVDVLIGPTLPFIAPDIGQDIADLNGEDVDFLGHVIRLTGPANVTGLPALSIPCGFKDGLPAGMQIIGPAFKEEVVLNMTYAFEQTNPLEGKRPTLEVGV